MTRADRVDLLCAFIRWTGLRVLEEPLARCKERGSPLRVITTTYMGATERRALDELVRRFGAEVRISYETPVHPAARQGVAVPAEHRVRHRLRRPQPVAGSAARRAGVERPAVAVATPGAVAQVRRRPSTPTGTTRPSSPTTRTGTRDRLDDASAAAAARGPAGPSRCPGSRCGRYPHQVRCSRHSRPSARCTAGTATSWWRRPAPARPSSPPSTTGGCASTPRPVLLFVAHRQEILEQSLRTYREVLGDGAFGELLRRRQPPGALAARLRQRPVADGLRRRERSRRDHFDIVVIDEFHHAEATTYRRLLDTCSRGSCSG